MMLAAIVPTALAGPSPQDTAGAPPGRIDAAQQGAECGLGLALSGGGARGIAQIGVLRAFEEAGMTFDCLAGTSMGAVIGALYASGYDSRQIEAAMRTAQRQDFFEPGASRRDAEQALAPLSRREQRTKVLAHVDLGGGDLHFYRTMSAAYRIHRLLTELLAAPNLLAGRDFDRLPVPFRAVGMDLETGERVVFSAGNLAHAVRASVSIPLVLPPVEIEGRLVVDGGLADNIPVDVALEMGAQRVVAIDTTSPSESVGPGSGVLDTAGRLIETMAETPNRLHWREPDLLIRPDLEGHSYTRYDGFDELIEQGYRAARDAIEEIRELRALTPSRRGSEVGAAAADAGTGGDAADAGTGGASRPPAPTDGASALDGMTVEEVRVEGNEAVAPVHVLDYFGIGAGERLPFPEALDGLDRIFASGLFRNAWIDFLPAGADAVTIVLHVAEEPRLMLDLGASLNDEDKARGFARLVGNNVLGRAAVSELEARASDREVTLEVSYLSPNTARPGPGFRVAGMLQREKPRVFAGGEFINRAEFLRLDLDGALDFATSRHSGLNAGARFGQVDVRPRLGLGFVTESNRMRIVYARFEIDTHDHQPPDGGIRMVARAERSLTGLGASQDFWRGWIDLRQEAILDGRHSVSGRLMIGISGGEVPVHEQFRIGGPELIPGLHRDELWNDQALGLAVGYAYRLMPGLWAHLNAGGGQAWALKEQIGLGSLRYGAGVGVSYSTALGPVSASYGIAHDGSGKLYVTLGYQ
jgi:NTE family protein